MPLSHRNSLCEDLCNCRSTEILCYTLSWWCNTQQGATILTFLTKWSLPDQRQIYNWILGHIYKICFSFRQFESNPLKKVQKVHPKNYRPKTFAHGNKSKILNFYVTFSLITFFAGVFFSFFNGFEIGIKFNVVYTQIIFEEKNSCSQYHFLHTQNANADETVKKNGKNFFL